MRISTIAELERTMFDTRNSRLVLFLSPFAIVILVMFLYNPLAFTLMVGGILTMFGFIVFIMEGPGWVNRGQR